ncbi:MAG TPA: iron-containing alcohol dehydrogenase [Actinomycetota bacterium]|nr:iron-containing alcohol dehydrogenase [Actinomycetota bacterium]
MEFPQVFVYNGEDEQGAAAELGRVVAAVGGTNPLVITSERGLPLTDDVPGAKRSSPPPDAGKEWASTLGGEIRRAAADLVVAIGGGRTLDIAKLAAARAGVTVITVPTQLSHDGLCSPVAVVPGGDGKTESLGAIAPRAVFLSLPTLLAAPLDSVRAGIGDLLANPLALRDWALAAEHGLTEVDRRAWDMSAQAFDLVEPYLDEDPAVLARRPEFHLTLADALVLSGMAMIVAGSSRPASGAEHEISHAIDELYGGRALHGAQVAFGCIVSVALYGDDTSAFRARLRRLGLPDDPAALDLTHEDMVKVLLTAPDTRPGRFTILEDAALDDAGARAVVASIWSD